MLAHKAVNFALRLQILFTIALTASLPTHVVPPESTISLPEQLNLTFPANSSLFSPSHKLNELPSDPILIRIPGCTLRLFFHDYGFSISHEDTYAVLLSAIEDVQLHLFPVVPMPRRFPGYLYSAESVRLMVQPEQRMTWAMWGDALTGLRLFLEKWEFVVVEFNIWDYVVGTGEVFMGKARLWGVR